MCVFTYKLQFCCHLPLWQVTEYFYEELQSVSANSEIYLEDFRIVKTESVV